MSSIGRLLWLPIAPENFFSAMTDPSLLDDRTASEGSCRADQETGIPHLRESVFRRLVQVLPLSFGYDPQGWYTRSDEPTEAVRPRSLTMTLRPASAVVGLASARDANTALTAAGVESVTMNVDEHGFYRFVAEIGPFADEEAADKALNEHMVTIFGGNFEVDRLGASPDRQRVAGTIAVRRYNGLDETRTRGERTELPVSPPRGALTFYQLNILLEGFCNASLLPAVFFEHYGTVAEWYEAHRNDSSIIIRLDDYLHQLIIPGRAGSDVDQARSLRQFLTISRGSLQWMRRSVESVRRSMVDQLMAVSHRQARLIQLNLVGLEYERTPEMTGAVTESQMRGYVMLIATKLPLLASVGDAGRGRRAEHPAGTGRAGTGRAGPPQRIRARADRRDHDTGPGQRPLADLGRASLGQPLPAPDLQCGQS